MVVTLPKPVRIDVRPAREQGGCGATTRVDPYAKKGAEFPPFMRFGRRDEYPPILAVVPFTFP